MTNFNFIKGLMVLSILILGLKVDAQQLPINNQIFLNNYAISPAYTGGEKDFIGYLGVRNNILGFDGINRLSMLNVNGMIGSNSAFGLHLESFDEGIMRQSQMGLSYAHHLSFTNTQYLSFGIDAGLFGNRINQDALLTKDGSDNTLSSSTINSNGYKVAFGVAYTHNKWNLGLSLPNILNTELAYIGSNLNYTLVRQYQLDAAYLIDDKFENLSIRPMIVARAIESGPYQLDFAVNSIFKEKYHFGIYYRSMARIGTMIGIQLDNSLILNYSYEYSNNLVLKGAHEIALRFNFSNKKRKRTPSNHGLNDTKYYKLESKFDSLNNEIALLKEAYNNTEQNNNDTISDLDQLKKEVKDHKKINKKFDKRLSDVETVLAIQLESLIAEGYYVIVKSTATKRHAVQSRNEWIEKGYPNTRIILSNGEKWYYVYIDSFDESKIAQRYLNEFRKKHNIYDGWVYAK